MLRKKPNQNLVLNQKMFFKKATEGRVRTEKAEKKKKNRRKQRWANEWEGGGKEQKWQTDTAVGSRASRPPRCHGNPGYL